MKRRNLTPRTPRTFVTTDKRILALSAIQNKEEVFKTVNTNKVRIDRSIFKNTTPLSLKKAKRLYRESGQKALVLTSNVISGSPLAHARLLQNLRY